MSDTKTKTLATLIDEQIALDQLMLEASGEITDGTEKIVDGWIQEIKSGIAHKVDGYEIKQQMLKKQAEMFSHRAEMFSKAAKACSNLSSNLKERLKWAMVELNQSDLGGNLYRYKLSQGKPSVQVYDESKIPAEFLVTVVTQKVDKDAIKAAIESGREVAGANLERGYTIRTYPNKGEV